MLYTISLYLIIFLLIIFSLKKQDKSNFSKEDSDALKGICAILILIHHIGLYHNVDGIFGYFNILVGDICVGIFFFLSAYGVTISSKHKDKYAIKILKNRIPKLYLNQIIINFIYFLIFFLTKKINIFEIIFRILNFDIFLEGEAFNSYSWFITTIILIYLFYALILLLTKNKIVLTSIILSTLIIFIYVFVRYTNIFDTLYVRSIPCFILGIWYALYEKEIRSFLKIQLVYIIMINLSISVITILLFLGISSLKKFIIIFICILIILFQQKVKINSRVFNFLSKISLEIYLFQLMFLKIFSPLINYSSILFILLVVFFTIIISFFFKHLTKRIFKEKKE